MCLARTSRCGFAAASVRHARVSVPLINVFSPQNCTLLCHYRREETKAMMIALMAAVIIFHESEDERDERDRRNRTTIGLAVAGVLLLLICIPWGIYLYQKKQARERAGTSLAAVHPMAFHGGAPPPTFTLAPLAAQDLYVPPPGGYWQAPPAYMALPKTDRDSQSKAWSRAPSDDSLVGATASRPATPPHPPAIITPVNVLVNSNSVKVGRPLFTTVGLRIPSKIEMRDRSLWVAEISPGKESRSPV
ncbi:hypothetical protein FB451DRAFT_1372431 [Mycena latifolia]|nr:hypothetical protein FB451DRAFT_1372431 [Mycena latifolia]